MYNLTIEEIAEKSLLIGKFITGTATEAEKERLNYLERKARNFIKGVDNQI